MKCNRGFLVPNFHVIHQFSLSAYQNCQNRVGEIIPSMGDDSFPCSPGLYLGQHKIQKAEAPLIYAPLTQIYAHASRRIMAIQDIRVT